MSEKKTVQSKINFRLVVGRFIYFALLALPPYIAFFSVAFVYLALFETIFSIPILFLSIPVAIAFEAFYTGWRDFIKNYTVTNFINSGFNPLEELDKLRRELGKLLNAKDIVEVGISVIKETLNPKSIHMIVIPSDSERAWLSFAAKGLRQLEARRFNLVANAISKLSFMPLISSQIDEEFLQKNKATVYLLEEALQVLEEYNLEIVYPIVQEKHLNGMIVLGKREEGLAYTKQQISFIEGVANALSLALGRSLLYEEIQEFNIQLQTKMEEATKELKVKNSKLEKALSALEDRRRIESDMVDVMGHELRTPISIVRNALMIMNNEFQASGGVSSAKLESYLPMAVESIRREISLLETLLSATKLEGNRVQFKFKKVDLVEVVKNSIKAHKYKADEKALKIIFQEPDIDISVYADPVRTQEIMDNYLSNALKYTLKGHIKITVSIDEEYGRIDVTDTGIGIAKDDLESLGKKFFRATKVFGDKVKYIHPSGTGLGLYVTCGLLGMMKGKRILKSEVGKGSTFSFELPLHTGQEDKVIDQTFNEHLGNQEQIE